MKVNGYRLAMGDWDGAPAPRAWRIAAPDGVFWLIEDGTAARLARLPMPGDDGAVAAIPTTEPWAALADLAHTAETEAAGRWVRGGQVNAPDNRPGEIVDDQP